MRQAAAIVVLGLAACGPFARGSGEAGADLPRLCVENGTVGYGNVIARAGLVRFNVMPGEEQCRPIMITGGSLELRAVTSGGGSAGPLSFDQTLHPGGADCWRWRLTNARASAVDLMPCEEEEDETDAPGDSSAARG